MRRGGSEGIMATFGGLLLKTSTASLAVSPRRIRAEEAGGGLVEEWDKHMEAPSHRALERSDYSLGLCVVAITHQP